MCKKGEIEIGVKIIKLKIKKNKSTEFNLYKVGRTLVCQHITCILITVDPLLSLVSKRKQLLVKCILNVILSLCLISNKK